MASRQYIRKLRRRRGVAAVEFALTFPVVALLLLATLEFGWYFSRLAMINSAAYDGARWGAQYSQPVQSEVQAVLAATEVLTDIGFDCDEINCVIKANRFRTGGVTMVELELNVEYDQLTGLIPQGSSRLSEWLFEAPDTLRARAVATVVAAL